jgi:uncharacterized Zn finger protein (UPF0148 family)
VLATPCPECGAFNPVCLPSPHLYRCDSCKYEGLPREQDVPRLQAMATTVRALEHRGLQLGETTTNMLASAQGARGLYLVVLALLLFPTILTTGVVDWASETADRPMLALTLAPALIMLFAAGVSATLIYRRHRALMAGCAADPPRAGDESGRCNVCGGPLASKPGTVVARCGFCGADNIVSQTTLARVERANESGADLFEQRLRRRERATRGSTRRAEVLVVGVTMVSCALIACRALDAVQEVGDVNRLARSLMAVPMGPRTCFGHDRGEVLEFGADRSADLDESIPSKGQMPRRGPRLSRLRGGEVVLADGSHGTVERVFARDGEAWIRVVGDSGVIERRVLGVCTLDRRF